MTVSRNTKKPVLYKLARMWWVQTSESMTASQTWKEACTLALLGPDGLRAEALKRTQRAWK